MFGAGHSDQHALGLHLGDRDLDQLERLAGAEEDGGGRGRRPWSALLARCPARRRRGARRTASIGVLVLDHAGDRDLRGGDHLDVDALARRGSSNMRAATPAWLRMPTPTMDTLATRSSAATPAAPDLRGHARPAPCSARARSARAQGERDVGVAVAADVLHDHVHHDVLAAPSRRTPGRRCPAGRARAGWRAWPGRDRG